MEKTKQQKEKQPEKSKATVWDCGSTLYDSFELKSFERQLDAAISSTRSLSMPHLTDNYNPRLYHAPPPRQSQSTKPPSSSSKKSIKISRSLNKLIKSIFRPKQNTSNTSQVSQNGSVYIYDRYGALTTIPEAPENTSGDYDHDIILSPEIRSSLVGRSVSDRFTASFVGISCA